MTTGPTQVDVHPIVKQIIDRDCHVGESYRTVIRHVVSKLRGGWNSFRAMSRSDRRFLMRQCIQQHRANRELYRAVMYPSYEPSDAEKE